MIQITTMEALRANENLSDIYDFYVEDLFLPEEGDLLELLGGSLYVAESDDDLTTITEMSGRPLIYHEWEIHEEFDNFTLLCEITNNAGGDVFIIPRSILNE